MSLQFLCYLLSLMGKLGQFSVFLFEMTYYAQKKITLQGYNEKNGMYSILQT